MHINKQLSYGTNGKDFYIKADKDLNIVSVDPGHDILVYGTKQYASGKFDIGEQPPSNIKKWTRIRQYQKRKALVDLGRSQFKVTKVPCWKTQIVTPGRDGSKEIRGGSKRELHWSTTTSPFTILQCLQIQAARIGWSQLTLCAFA